MPSKGWRTLTVREVYFDILSAAYKRVEKDLLDEDIRNFNSYINEKILKGVAIQEVTSRFRAASYLESEIVVEDRFLRKSFRVALKDGALVCLTDETADDIHTFYVRHDPKVGAALKAKGLLVTAT